MVYSSPNSLREYRFDLRTNPTPTPIQVLWLHLSRKKGGNASFFYSKLISQYKGYFLQISATASRTAGAEFS